MRFARVRVLMMLCRLSGARAFSAIAPVVVGTPDGGTAVRVVVKNTGLLRRLPQAPKGKELLRRAITSAKKVEWDKTQKNNKLRARKRAAMQANEMAQVISVPLREMIKTHNAETLRRTLHAFEYAQANLTQSARRKNGGRLLDEVLKDIQSLRREVLEDAKAGAALAKAASSAAECEECTERTQEKMAERITQYSPALEELREIQRAFRRLPTVTLSAPTVVFVGAPNVGKSTMVTELSTGEPEIGNYAFTTRAVTLGHVYEQGKKMGQVMDTPGLLDREDDERNEMEELTLATMRHLPSAVVFVVDLSSHAGTAHSSPEKQLAVRNHLRNKFPKRPWLDVISKSDLTPENALIQAPEGAVFVSMRLGTGVDELRAEVLGLMEKVRAATRSHFAQVQNKPNPDGSFDVASYEPSEPLQVAP